MAPPTNRKEILTKLYAQIADGKIIVGAGAGIGLSAKFVEAGGGDLIIIYNSGRFRMAGRGSLAGLMPYGNANLNGEIIFRTEITHGYNGTLLSLPSVLAPC